MATVEIPELASPVSENDPCGPDLELAGDADFMNFMARAEGLLPSSFFSGPGGKPLDHSSLDLGAEFTSAKPFLAKTRDLRLLVLLAKFCMLARDLDGFIGFVSAVGTLLNSQWDQVHPRGADSEFGIRLAVLETLDDMAPVIVPLQYVPLIESRRLGPISYRQFMFATGQAEPREGEELHDLATLEQASAEVELSNLIERRDQFERLQAALDAIKKACAARLPLGAGVDLKKVSDLTANIFVLLNGLVIKLDPSAAKTVPDALIVNEPSPKAAGSARIKSSRDVAAALAAVADYFTRCEPSNPALLFARQAEQLIGKSLPEIMQILMPAQFEQAKFLIDKDQAFEIPIGRLAQFDSIKGGAALPDGNSGADPSPDVNVPSTDGAAAVADTGGAAGNGQAADTRSETFNEVASSDTSHVGASVATRQAALMLLEEIAAYYRSAEPSSPIALITERARRLADRDFLGLLKELLPKS